jgi:hypothetical protein
MPAKDAELAITIEPRRLPFLAGSENASWRGRVCRYRDVLP